MRFEFLRSSALLTLAALLSSCDSEQPLEPIAQETPSTARADANIIAPSNLVATVQAENRIRLIWQDNSSNEKGFELLRSPTGPSGTLELYVETIAAGATSYIDTGVEPTTTYCYAVRAFKVSGRTKSYSTLSPTACATTPASPGAPAAPTEAAAVSTNSSTVTVTWADNANDETGFQVDRAPVASGPWESAGATSSDVTSLSDAGRSADQQVCYRIAAVNQNGRSVWSEVACAIPPAAPVNLRATGSGQTTITLTWSDKSTVEDGYELQRASTDQGQYSIVASLAANDTSYRDEGLATDQPYWYRVRAKRAGGFSNFAGPAAGVAAGTPPAAPTWVSASPFNGWSTYLVWNANSTNAAGFRLERSDGGAPWATIMTFGPAGATGIMQAWDDKHYPQELEICYRVIAFNAVGEASDSGCTALPAVPIDLSARVVDGAVELSWTDISRFEDGYYIVRADNMSMGFYYVYDAVGPNTTTYRDPSPDPDWSSYYLRAMKGPEGYSCCSNAVDVIMPSGGGP